MGSSASTALIPSNKQHLPSLTITAIQDPWDDSPPKGERSPTARTRLRQLSPQRVQRPYTTDCSAQTGGGWRGARGALAEDNSSSAQYSAAQDACRPCTSSDALTGSRSGVGDGSSTAGGRRAAPVPLRLPDLCVSSGGGGSRSSAVRGGACVGGSGSSGGCCSGSGGNGGGGGAARRSWRAAHCGELREKALAAVARALFTRAVPWQSHLCARAMQDCDAARVAVLRAREAAAQERHRLRLDGAVVGLIAGEEEWAAAFGAAESEAMEGFQAAAAAAAAAVEAAHAGDEQRRQAQQAALAEHAQGTQRLATLCFEVDSARADARLSAALLDLCMWGDAAAQLQLEDGRARAAAAWQRSSALRARGDARHDAHRHLARRASCALEAAALRCAAEEVQALQAAEDARAAAAAAAEVARGAASHRAVAAEVAAADDAEAGRAARAWQLSAWLSVGAHRLVADTLMHGMSARADPEDTRRGTWEAAQTVAYARAERRTAAAQRSADVDAAALNRALRRRALRDNRRRMESNCRENAEGALRARAAWVSAGVRLRRHHAEAAARTREARQRSDDACLSAQREREAHRWMMLSEGQRAHWQGVSELVARVAEAVRLQAMTEDERQRQQDSAAELAWQEEAAAVAAAEAQAAALDQTHHAAALHADSAQRDAEDACVSDCWLACCAAARAAEAAALDAWARAAAALAAAHGALQRHRAHAILAQAPPDAAAEAQVEQRWREACQELSALRGTALSADEEAWNGLRRARAAAAAARGDALADEERLLSAAMDAAEADAVERWRSFCGREWARIKAHAAAGDADAGHWARALSAETREFWAAEHARAAALVRGLADAYTAAEAEEVQQLEVEAAGVAAAEGSSTDVAALQAASGAVEASAGVVGVCDSSAAASGGIVLDALAGHMATLPSSCHQAPLCPPLQDSLGAIREALQQHTGGGSAAPLQPHQLLPLLTAAGVTECDAAMVLSVVDVSACNTDDDSGNAATVPQVDPKQFMTAAAAMLQLLQQLRAVASANESVSPQSAVAAAAAAADAASEAQVHLELGVLEGAAGAAHCSLYRALACACRYAQVRSAIEACPSIFSNADANFLAAALSASPPPLLPPPAADDEAVRLNVRETLSAALLQLRRAQVAHGCLWSAACDVERCCAAAAAAAAAASSDVDTCAAVLAALGRASLAPPLRLCAALLSDAAPSTAADVAAAGACDWGDGGGGRDAAAAAARRTAAALVAALSPHGAGGIALLRVDGSAAVGSCAGCERLDALLSDGSGERACQLLSAELAALSVRDGGDGDGSDSGGGGGAGDALPCEVVVCAMMGGGGGAWRLTRKQATAIVLLSRCHEESAASSTLDSTSTVDAAAAATPRPGALLRRRSTLFDYLGTLGKAYGDAGLSAVTCSVRALLQCLPLLLRVVRTAHALGAAAACGDDERLAEQCCHHDSSGGSSSTFCSSQELSLPAPVPSWAQLAAWREGRVWRRFWQSHSQFSCGLDRALARLRYERLTFGDAAAATAADGSSSDADAARQQRAARRRVERQREFDARAAAERSRVGAHYAQRRSAGGTLLQSRRCAWDAHAAASSGRMDALAAAARRVLSAAAAAEAARLETLQRAAEEERACAERKAAALRAMLDAAEEGVAAREAGAFAAAAEGCRGAVASAAEAEATEGGALHASLSAAVQDEALIVSTLGQKLAALHGKLAAARKQQGDHCRDVADGVTRQLVAALTRAEANWAAGVELADISSAASLGSTGVTGHIQSKKKAVTHWAEALEWLEAAAAQLDAACAAMAETAAVACSEGARALAVQRDAFAKACRQTEAQVERRVAAACDAATAELDAFAAAQHARVRAAHADVGAAAARAEADQISYCDEQIMELCRSVAVPLHADIVAAGEGAELRGDGGGGGGNTCRVLCAADVLGAADTDAAPTSAGDAAALETALQSLTGCAEQRARACHTELVRLQRSNAAAAADALEAGVTAALDRRVRRQVGSVVSDLLCVVEGVCGCKAAVAARCDELSAAKESMLRDAAAAAARAAEEGSAACTAAERERAEHEAQARAQCDELAARVKASLAGHVEAVSHALERARKRQGVGGENPTNSISESV
ncbi:hypothetical protein JKP88DRAFT_284806 [Tribonema minus]|uniref:Uncharacterized protein n=1 Tax=Tribonema minus TaxID=303371 RepID=A0A835ZH23_9STRA|nr:hypothetical protein JKP88DRAFT_284806 [Tribonema minus]